MATSQEPDTHQASSASRRLPAWLTVVVLVVAVGITTALCLSAASIHEHNETRLLQVELGQAASIVSVAIPSIESPLTSAVNLAAVTGGSASGFLKYMGPYVGGSSLFVSASLWHITPSGPVPVA